MPPQTRRASQPRGGPQARAATARRRVRTTSNANNVGAMATYRRRYRATKASGRRVQQIHRKLQRMSLAGLLWLLITFVIAVVAVAAQSMGAAAAAGGSLAVTAGVEKYKRRKGRTGIPAPPRKNPNPRGKPSPRSTGGTPGTGPKGKPTSGPKSKPLDGGGPRPRVCGPACKQSTKPKSTCKCTATDCQHGSEAGAGAKT